MSNYKINGREFTLAPLVTAVELKLYNTIRQLLEELPEETRTQLLKRQFAIKDWFEILDLLGAFAIENQCRLIACILLEKGTSEKEKDIKEYAEFLTYNLIFQTKIEIIHDFFTQSGLHTVLPLIQAILQVIRGFLKKQAEALNLKHTATS